MLTEDGSFCYSSEEEEPQSKRQRADNVEEEYGDHLSEATLEERVEEDGRKKKRKRKFVQAVTDESDPMPPQYRHLRESERKVKDKVLIAIGNLVGEGLSLNEAAKAIVEVGNVVFGRKWKQSLEDMDTFDLDTLPDRRNMREALKMQEA